MSDSGLRRRLSVLLAAAVLMGILGGLVETTFNNYLSESFGISDRVRGYLEFPRELPGFLVTVVAGFLVSLSLNRVGFVAMALAAVGAAGLAFSAGRFGMMLPFMVIYSTGVHLNIPTLDSLTLSTASRGRPATRLGQVGAAGILGGVCGAGLVAVLTGGERRSYTTIYLLASFFALAAALALVAMGSAHGQTRRRTFVFRKHYGLYYTLSALYGARKQIFLTFGPWVIVRLFGQPPRTFALLWITYSAFGLFFRPMMGRFIDWWGERRILIAEGIVLAFVCITYALAGQAPRSPAALMAVMTVYVIDQLCFAVSMARTTYLSKIASRPEDIPGSLASGVSIDHLASMMLPILGGYVWERYGFQYVFIGAAFVAGASSIASTFVRVPVEHPSPLEQAVHPDGAPPPRQSA